MRIHSKKLLLIILCFFATANAWACEIEFNLPEGKEVFAVGDILVIETEVVFTHRVCPIALKETKFKHEGVKILGATPWKEVTPMRYTRKLKIQIVKSKKNKSKITAVRSCDKEGGFGSIVIPISE